ncbi:MAG: hypothetical protein IKE37_07065, partial [Firmicutes bacterium]|nr:hypothetical protein [Bacillota bacterium]
YQNFRSFATTNDQSRPAAGNSRSAAGNFYAEKPYYLLPAIADAEKNRYSEKNRLLPPRFLRRSEKNSRLL